MWSRQNNKILEETSKSTVSKITPIRGERVKWFGVQNDTIRQTSERFRKESLDSLNVFGDPYTDGS